MPVVVTVGVDVDHFGAARFFDTARTFGVFFFFLFSFFGLTFDRQEQPLGDFHRRRGQFFFHLLQPRRRLRGQHFFVFFGFFHRHFGFVTQFRLCARAPEVKRARADVVDIAIEAQQQLRGASRTHALYAFAFRPEDHVVRRIGDEIGQQRLGRFRSKRRVQRPHERYADRQDSSERTPRQGTMTQADGHHLP
jgi:hypothetical protein